MSGCFCDDINGVRCPIHAGTHYQQTPKPSETEGVREWTIFSETNECGVDGPSTSGNKVRVVEKSAFIESENQYSLLKERFAELQQELSDARREVEVMTEKFERNSIAAGEYSLEVDELKKRLAIVALDRDSNHFLLTQERLRSTELLSALDKIELILRNEDPWDVKLISIQCAVNSGKGG